MDQLRMALCQNQILHCDCFVGEARRIDVDLLADQALADHELLRAIDAINRNNLAALEVEGGEAAPVPPVAPHHDALITLAEADDLQLDVVLVGPEPGQRLVGLFLVTQACRGSLGLVGGVGHRLQPQALLVKSIWMIGAVTSRDDIAIGGTAVFIDQDAVIDGQPGFLCQFDIGQDADANHHQVGRDQRAVGTADLLDMIATFETCLPRRVPG